MYIHNHVGSFAAAGEAFAKALVLSGVTKRFPNLNFAFLEGGVAWASELYAGLVGHCGKRNPTAIGNYDPHNLDRVQLADLMGEFGAGVVSGRPDPNDATWLRWPGGWARGGRSTDRTRTRRARNHQCRGSAAAFRAEETSTTAAGRRPAGVGRHDARLNPGARLNAIFSSDIGHWDVPDMNDVLEEAYELVEHGLLDMNDFKEFTFTMQRCCTQDEPRVLRGYRGCGCRCGAFGSGRSGRRRALERNAAGRLGEKIRCLHGFRDNPGRAASRTG